MCDGTNEWLDVCVWLMYELPMWLETTCGKPVHQYLSHTEVQIAGCNDVSQCDGLPHEEGVLKQVAIQHLEGLLH